MSPVIYIQTTYFLSKKYTKSPRIRSYFSPKIPKFPVPKSNLNMFSKSSDTVHDKSGKPIHIGDTVSTKARGGKRVGEVDDIVVSKQEAQEKNVKNPPKVLFRDQHCGYPIIIILGKVSKK